ncbi:MAG: carbohydrate kinase family protein [Candidatus Moranbacteria bacterium]|nr:carbohydrate kinase family protein [Candidatus Moranbacteria bacterium]
MFWSKTKTKVTCVGSSSKDAFFPNDEGVFVETPKDLVSPKKVQFPLGGKILVPDRYEDVGGVAANVAIGLSRLGHKTRIVSRRGDDMIGDFITNALAADGVDTSRLITLRQTQSDLSAIIVFMQTGERTIFHNRDANEQLHVSKEDLRGTEWVFVSALNGEWQHNIDIIRENKAKLGYKIALNPGQHNLKSDLNCMREFLKHVDILVLNHDEAIMLLGTDDSEAIKTEASLMEALSKLGPQTIGLTDGSRGAWAYQNTTFAEKKPDKVDKVVDSTGAGDAFASGFFGALLYNHSLEEALTWGIKNSAANLKQYGATKGLLSKDAVTRE